MKLYTKDSLIKELRNIRSSGWIKSQRQGNAGGVGNTLEDLLEISENNLPIPNAAEWELKCQRIDSNSKTGSLTTLFHMEPSPQALRFVPAILLAHYGWKHKEAGKRYPNNEKSFRQTINALGYSDRGFSVIVDRQASKILISFKPSEVHERHSEWLSSVKNNIGLSELNPQPYWGFSDLYHKAGTKLHNCFFIGAKVKKEKGIEFFSYEEISMLSGFSLTRFIKAIEDGYILVDFDARTHHNHGTKFRCKQNKLPELYDDVTRL